MCVIVVTVVVLLFYIAHHVVGSMSTQDNYNNRQIFVLNLDVHRVSSFYVWKGSCDTGFNPYF